MAADRINNINSPSTNFPSDKKIRTRKSDPINFDRRLDEKTDRVQSPFENKLAEQGENETFEQKDSWLKQRTNEEIKAIVKAVQLGVKDPWQLTDLIFFSCSLNWPW